MKKIPFEASDIEAIRSGVKNMTLRISKETDRYNPGDVCQVVDYADQSPAGIRIRINSVQLTSARKLDESFKNYDLTKLGENAIARNIPVAVVCFAMISP
ncbi:MAG: ASCH domain-containing protein [Methanomassiliicoccales archaeon]|jgi:hypothetical protein